MNCEVCNVELERRNTTGRCLYHGRGSKKYEVIVVEKKCKKCSKVFYVNRRKRPDGSIHVGKKENKFCGRKCGNSRERSEEVRRKISESLKGNIPWSKGKTFSIKNRIVIEKRKCNVCEKEIKKDSITGLCKKCLFNDKKLLSQINKRSYTNGNNYVAGGNTKWYDYKNIRVQGTYELRFCKILDKLLELGRIKKWEYTNDRFKYIGVDNKPHNYLLDFKVMKNDNSFCYVETKGYIRENDELKWNAVRQQGFELKVYFEKNLERFEKYLSKI